MLAFMKVLQPKTVEEAYELATKKQNCPNASWRLLVAFRSAHMACSD